MAGKFRKRYPYLQDENIDIYIYIYIPTQKVIRRKRTISSTGNHKRRDRNNMEWTHTPTHPLFSKAFSNITNPPPTQPPKHIQTHPSTDQPQPQPQTHWPRSAQVGLPEVGHFAVGEQVLEGRLWVSGRPGVLGAPGPRSVAKQRQKWSINVGVGQQ